jgi:T-complex protein 1 subunit zeta
MSGGTALLQELSPNAEIVSKQQALKVNVSAAVGSQNVLKTNLGPTGTLKLLVGVAPGQLKITKGGVTLFKEMQIQHPTAALIARTATVQDEITGDGTTSTVLLMGELLRHVEYYSQEGLHPHVSTDGLDVAHDACLEFLKNFAVAKANPIEDRDTLLTVARTSLSTKIDGALVEKVRVTKMVETIWKQNHLDHTHP